MTKNQYETYKPKKLTFIGRQEMSKETILQIMPATKHIRKLYLLSCHLLIFWSLTMAQPAQFFLGGNDRDQIAQIIRASDGSFLATGAKTIGSSKLIWLLKLSQNGSLIWERTFNTLWVNTDGYGHDLLLLPDGSIIISGEQRPNDIFSPGSGIVIKTNANGNEIWKRAYTDTDAVFDALQLGNNLVLVGWNKDTGSSEEGFVMLVDANGILQWIQTIEVYNRTKIRNIFKTNDGNLLLVGRTSESGFRGIFLRKIDLAGVQFWQKIFNAGWREDSFSSSEDFYNQSLGATLLPDGTLWLVNPFDYNTDVVLFQFSEEGDLLQQKKYGDPLVDEYPYGLTALPDGGWLIVGEANMQGFAMRVAGNGLELWRQYYGAGDAVDRLFSSVYIDDSRFIFAGMSNNVAGNGDNDGWLLRAEADGNILPWTIEGHIILDSNNNCIADAGEPVAAGWFLEATDTTTRLIVTDEQGKFKLRTGDGSTTLSALAPDPAGIWQFCNDNQIIFSSSDNPITQLNFLAQATDGGCPHTEVSITQPDLVRCSSSTFIITVINRGAGESGDLLLNLVADPALSIVSASEPFLQNGTSIDIEIAPMGVFQQKSIEINANLSCDVQLSATHGMFARLYPLECATSWNGPRFGVEGWCTGSEVLFSLKNSGGGGPNAATRYRIMADDLLYSDWTDIILPEGAAPLSMAFPADGRTWRIELEQAPDFPSASRPAMSIEGCGQSTNGLHAIAFRNAWHFDDGMPEAAAVLAPNTTGVPNKVAEALHGFGLYNFVGENNWLEFTARLRNPLQVAAENIEFQFSFSPNLNIRTFQVVASNGPVELAIENNNFLKATMQHLQIDTGDFAMLRFRILPFAEMPPDSDEASLMLVNANVYVNGYGPYSLYPGFHNYTHTFPVEVDEYNVYPPEILRFGGRSRDFGTVMAMAPDGSVFLAGESSSYSDRTNTDGLIIKTDTTGRAYWLNAIDLGDQTLNTFKGVAPLPDGGCMVAGNYLSPNLTDNYLLNNYAYVARLDAYGRMMWHKKFRPAGQQFNAWTNGIVPTPDGRFILFGYTDNGVNNSDQFYLKLDENGDIIWQQYEQISGSAFKPLKAVPTPDGGFVFLGTNESTSVDLDVYLEKIDANGNKLWSDGYESENGIYLGGLAPMPDGGFLVSGYSQWQVAQGQSGITPTFIRFTPDGNFQWEKNPVVGPFKIAYSNDIIPAPDGGFLSVGEIFVDTLDHLRDMMLLKLDENADTLWWRNYGSKNTELASDILIVSPDQVLIWGFNQSRPPLWDLQAVLVRTDLNGNPLVDVEPEPAMPMTNATVFPNPAHEYIHVSVYPAPAINNLQWHLYDLRGAQILKGVSISGEFEINLEGIPAGMYFLTFSEQGIPVQRVAVLP